MQRFTRIGVSTIRNKSSPLAWHTTSNACFSRGVPSAPATVTATRTLTNASRPDYISSLTQVPRVNEKPGGWHPTLVHSSGDLKFTVIRLRPGGGEVPSHLHNKAWDYFVPLSGEAVIGVKTKDGTEKEYHMKPDTFLAVPPEDIHRVRNTSDTEEFVFFIVQAPRHQYDYIAK